MKFIIDIPEKVKASIDRVGLLRIPDEQMTEIDVAIQSGKPLNKLRSEIYQLHGHPKLDFIKNDEVVDMALDVIDKYR